MASQRQVIHRTTTDHIDPSYEGKPVHLHIPTYTLAEFRQAYPGGRLVCGSCGELKRIGDMSKLEGLWGADAVINIALSHDYFPDEISAGDPAPAEESQALAQCPVLYTDGAREEYVLNADGRYEWLYGIVFRDARSPERVYREVWFPTGVFLPPEEVPNAQA